MHVFQRNSFKSFIIQNLQKCLLESCKEIYVNLQIAVLVQNLSEIHNWQEFWPNWQRILAEFFMRTLVL